ncbi:uncharacterized protein LOC108226437 isoform X1 [Daucus carota subsp. sativus]|uniref:uncharacterized protein LOC108226437 isoform X1 n=1 Tax=Daucus carota subsp. sativus TaxID=79200 RepID=UPI0030839119
MRRNWLILLLILVVFFVGCSSASSSPPAKIVSGVVSKVVSLLLRWLWSLTSNKPTALSGRSKMKFEGGYTVETVFDGSKLGIEPYSVEVSPSGDLLVLDSANSNIYKISTPLSRYSRPKLVAGSSEGYSGHVDGKPREARLNHPKGHTIDERGNIYVADTTNMAIRKISDAGVVTIAGGTLSRGGGHVDGPSEDAKFSNDFDVVYVGSTCSLLVVDRGNQAIREIQLNDDECSQKYDGDLNLGIAVLAAAGFFGYMMALLQRRLIAMFSSPDSYHEHRDSLKGFPPAPYQKPPVSVRRPLIPAEHEHEPEREEGFFGSLHKLLINTSSSVVELFGGLFSGFRKPVHPVQQQYYQQLSRHANTWPVQESFVIPNGDAPPPLERRDPTPRKTYQSTTKDMEKSRQYKQNQSFYGGWNGDFRQQQQFQQHMQQQQQQLYQHLQQQQHKQIQQHHQRHQSSSPQTYYEQNCETNEIVFGAVQEHDGRHEAVVIKALDYADPKSSNIRSRYNYTGYSYGY